jgi:diguanylate cyclase (GGDEF)-like protein
MTHRLSEGIDEEVKEVTRYKVLIADDEKMNLMALHRILSTDYTVFAAESGQDALKLADENLPDLILLDAMLPDIDGFEVLERLKESQATRQIPVIVITGLDSDDDELKGFSLGAADFIARPFKREIVKLRVKTQIQIVSLLRTIEEISLVDPLTNLSNHRCFNERADLEWKRAIREKTHISFLMIDIDKFRTYNAIYGQFQGDILLKSIARMFQSVARRPADLPARLGGEEFGLLLPNTNLEAALVIAEELRSCVEEMKIPTADEGLTTCATISIGVASLIPTEEEMVSDFIVKAGERLKYAKSVGRNRIIYSG